MRIWNMKGNAHMNWMIQIRSLHIVTGNLRTGYGMFMQASHMAPHSCRGGTSPQEPWGKCGRAPPRCKLRRIKRQLTKMD